MKEYTLYVWFSGQSLNASIHHKEKDSTGKGVFVSTPPKEYSTTVFKSLLNFAQRAVCKKHQIVLPPNQFTLNEVIDSIKDYIAQSRDEETAKGLLFRDTWRTITDVVPWIGGCFPGAVHSVVQVDWSVQTADDERKYIRKLIEEYTEKFKKYGWRIADVYYDHLDQKFRVNTNASTFRRLDNVTEIHEFFENCIIAAERNKETNHAS